MLDKTNTSSVRCPKCSEPMRLVEDAPHFAIFLLPSRSYHCDPCQIALSYPPDEDECDTQAEVDRRSSVV